MSSFISVGALNFSLRTAVYGNEELACKQLCSGANAYYALVQLGECMCTNTTDNGEFVQPNSTAASEDLITMHNLALYLWREKTCEKLYEKQVRNNGWYYMQENDAPVYCSFADGTPCEDGWVGYAGSCYWFEMQYMNFDDSLSECLSKNSSLAPLRNKDIMSFVDGFIKDFHSDLYQVMWRFGATDVHSMSSYEWLDGSLSDEFFYRSGFPAYDYYDCLYLHKGSWIDGHCVTETPFICSKEQGMFRCVDFDEGNNPDVEVSKQTNAQMNRQLCIQICGGQLSVNALLKKKDCLCTNTSIESRVTYLPESECRSPCPGNEHQLCGGNNNKYSYKNGLNNIRAANCKVLERQGIGDINVMLLNSSQPTFCPNPECPFSWIKRPGYSSCYKFALSVSRVRSALEYCSSHSASLVSVDDLEELEFLQGLITNVQSDSSTSNWIIVFDSRRMNIG
ncbi:C-type mannose receptor 2-like [Saccostrea cucullata]|uniref:C-type mannose receptor 2-like n=1 Tax=Saccostrea cuccullata TaxID=36930 RepID=UPI002ED6C052